MAVYTGTRGHLSEVGCSGYATISSIRLTPTVGTTYYVMIGDVTPLNGGHLRFDADLAFDVHLSIDKGLVDPRTGYATVSGSVTCNKPAYISTTGGELRQTVGRYTVRGPIYVYGFCAPSLPWSAVVVGDSGPFKGGKASARLSIFAYASDTGDFLDIAASKTLVLTK
jgi:hypothetical protein